MTITPAKPGKGKPQTEAQKAAVLAMEQEVVERHAVRGHSFYRIEQDLGITHADRIYKRAMSVRPVRQREEAYATLQARNELLWAEAQAALERDGLGSLATRIAEMVREYDPEDDQSTLLQRVETTIGKAYADTYRGIPVAGQVLDRMAKHEGLNHADRVADAQLVIDAAKVQVMAGALVQALAVLEVSVEDKRRVIERWGELVQVDPDVDTE